MSRRRKESIDGYRFRGFWGFWGLLLIVDWFLFFRHAGHFFQGDTVFLLSHRATSITGFLSEFIKLHSSGWYRPLANEFFESILYPIFGLSPVAYRIPVYAVFIAITIGVYSLAYSISNRRLVAALAAFFFTIHTVNAYVTYDLGFMPELLYGLFYIVAAISFLRYVRDRNRSAYYLSMVCFVASLLSKEAAVTLPGILLLLYLMMDTQSASVPARFVRAVRSIVPHAVILAVYLVLVAGYLHVGGFSLEKLFHKPEGSELGQYNFVVDSAIWKNSDLALTWAFNIPRGWWGQWRPLTPGMIAWLKVFRVLLLGLAALSLLLGRERKSAVFGIAWFFVTVLPALPLVDHFIPYYLFVPVIGLSILAGAAFTWAHDKLSAAGFAGAIAGTLSIAVFFGGLLYLTDRSIRGDIRDNMLLGGSAKRALNTLSDLEAGYPSLPPNARIYFDDAQESLSWEHSSGDLIKMAYKSDRVSLLYTSLGDGMPADGDRGSTMLFSVRDNHLVDRTAEYRVNPERFIHYTDSENYRLELSAAEVTAGRDKYKLTIHGAHDMPVRITYTIDDGPIQGFTVGINHEGSATFDVSEKTKKGVYKFLGFNISGDGAWVRSDKTIAVR